MRRGSGCLVGAVKGVLGLGLLLTVLAVIVARSSGPPRSSRPASSPAPVPAAVPGPEEKPAEAAPAADRTTPVLGEAVRVGKPGESVMLAVDDPAWDEMLQLQLAKDIDGLGQLLRAGRVFLVDGGTPGKRIEIGFTSERVRIAEGAEAGKAGWVQRELVHADR